MCERHGESTLHELYACISAHSSSLIFCLAHSRKRSCHDEREHYRRLCVHLHAVPVKPDLPPADGLVRPRPCVASIKLLRRVDVNGALGSIAHQVRVGDVVLHQSAAQYNHARPLRPYRDCVDLPDILYDIDAQLLRRRLECVKVQHVAQTTICQCWAEDGDVVFPRPVVD